MARYMVIACRLNILSNTMVNMMANVMVNMMVNDDCRYYRLAKPW